LLEPPLLTQVENALITDPKVVRVQIAKDAQALWGRVLSLGAVATIVAAACFFSQIPALEYVGMLILFGYVLACSIWMRRLSDRAVAARLIPEPAFDSRTTRAARRRADRGTE